ncbi:ABC transporter ATP-binding protein [Tropicimonas sp. IMCC34011]|uniref:ABC transporter ATP-binding protein n=1 Tax=Tropicimonas sp. IMCC34011 TaxID=2248759 RepID=UPI000E279EB3|nr:ABC transporter ATP-binding protein [Tropicimonas sp. IMCC34011]
MTVQDAAGQGTPALSVDGAAVAFGSLRVVDGASFDVPQGRITGLIGPNGAGKSTLFNAITGNLPLAGGRILHHGQPIHGQSPNQIFGRGIARTFQIPRPFSRMTVFENVLVSAPGQPGERVWRALLGGAGLRRGHAELTERVRDVIAFCNLDDVRDQPAGAISGGQQKLLELARVLIADPDLILLDEPAAGVNPRLLDTLVEKIVTLNQQGKTFLVIEHNMDMVMSLCDPIVVLARGSVILSGSADQVASDPQVIEAYLGGEAA